MCVNNNFRRESGGQKYPRLNPGLRLIDATVPGGDERSVKTTQLNQRDTRKGDLNSGYCVKAQRFERLSACQPAVIPFRDMLFGSACLVFTIPAKIFFVEAVKPHLTMNRSNVDSTTFGCRTYPSTKSLEPLNKVRPFLVSYPLIQWSLFSKGDLYRRGVLTSSD